MGTPKTGRTFDCAQCGEEFYRPMSQILLGRAKYCSRKCMVIAKSGSDDLAEAFWLKVDKSAGPDGCWLYTGFRKWDGYGWLARKFPGDAKPRYLTAHRYSWMLTHGEPPKGIQVLHRCDNPPCCNPSHLWLGTHQDNHADKSAKGRVRTRHSKDLLHPDRVRPRKQAAT